MAQNPRRRINQMAAPDPREQEIPRAFKDWCADQVPPLSPTLKAWDDPAVQERFRPWHTIQQAARKSLDELHALRLKKQNERIDAEQAARRAKFREFGLVPEDFRSFLKEMGHRCADHSAYWLEHIWLDDALWRGLYAIWREERPAVTETP